ncbi:HMG domain-containing protein 4 isoform X2 [Rhinatrema bivittatum]|uniref:HMG domain-containing protein 4 isoform X2 n=1 Tax=Rhinatrema bivittatum TaxID=194408 RepID=UPI001128868A|nr:HMG domain-containing protein 4 isoform X2 [Rhinatrema bivittatum]
MAYDDSRKKEECLENDRGIDELGLVAGRSQREKKRSYKDLLREEEEIAAQDSDLFFLGTDVQKKKKKHSSEDFYYSDVSPLELPVKKKKKVLISPSADTAMDLLKAITSPTALSSKPPKKIEKSSFGSSSFSAHSEGKKEHRKEHRKMHSEVSRSSEDGLHKSKKSKSLFVNTETLTLREPDGLKMKLILSPKEKGITEEEAFPYPGPPSQKKSSKKALREDQTTFLLAHELPGFPKPIRKKPKTEPHLADGFGPEASIYAEATDFELTGLESLDTGSSSGGELEAGELVIDDSYREVKKKKKSKKSKKKKDKEKHREDKHREKKHREEKHSKSKKGLSLSSGEVGMVAPLSGASVQQPAISIPYTLPPPLPPPPVFHSDAPSEKKKKKEEKEKEKAEKLEKPKKKNMSAYQVFCKEYRVNIVAEYPGIDFGELSKKLAEVWKQLPEKEKLVWKQKAQYLQHKQNKAEATTVKRKPSASEAASKAKAGVISPHKKSPSSSLAVSSSPAKVPETEPIDVAAHLQLLGESLSLIGHRLQETEFSFFLLPGDGRCLRQSVSASGFYSVCPGAAGLPHCPGPTTQQLPKASPVKHIGQYCLHHAWSLTAKDHRRHHVTWTIHVQISVIPKKPPCPWLMLLKIYIYLYTYV